MDKSENKTPAAAEVSQPATNGEPEIKRSKAFGVVIWAVTLALTVVTVYGLIHFKTNTGDPYLQAQNNTAGHGRQFDKLNNVALRAPSSLKKQNSQNIGISTVKDYIIGNGACELQFGTLMSSQLPGDDLSAMVQGQLGSYRNSGATVSTPMAQKALTLKVAGSSKEYSLPTLSFTLSKSGTEIKSYYSAAILKNGDRVFVTRACSSNNGHVSDTVLNNVDHTAQDITVEVK
jgi:hypothetical protein